jgi:hypothetical protein
MVSSSALRVPLRPTIDSTALTGVSCTSTGFFAALDLLGRALVAPGGRRSAPVPIDEVSAAPLSVSCPTEGRCLAVDGNGRQALLNLSFVPVLPTGLHDLSRRPSARDAAVVRSRAAGASWSQIGTSLGMTQQSAHQRFRGIDPAVPASPITSQLPFELRVHPNDRPRPANLVVAPDLAALVGSALDDVVLRARGAGL